MRKSLDMLQGDVAKHLKLNQNAVSRIENGAGGGINVLLKLLNFYSEFFEVEHILSPKFEIVKRSESPKPLESVAIERLKLLQQEFNGEIEELILLLGK